MPQGLGGLLAKVLPVTVSSEPYQINTAWVSARSFRIVAFISQWSNC